MVILIFSFCFLAALVLTRAYRYAGRYYPTVLYVSCCSLLYQLLCRGHLLWHFRDWFFFTDKLSTLTQFVVLFPCTIILYLRYLPKTNRHKTLYLLGFFGLYALMEWCLKQSGEIIYQFGWTFWWSLAIDLCLFALAWIHERNWKIALSISTAIIVFLMVGFGVPLQG